MRMLSQLYMLRREGFRKRHGMCIFRVFCTILSLILKHSYSNFDIDGHKTIFSTIDAEHRAPRAKAVLPMFSTKSIRDNEVALYDCVDRVVERMQKEASTGRPVNVLNLGRSLAVDAVSTHLFQQNYDGTSEKGNRLSVSAFVDAFVAVGRFFYLPGLAFVWLEWLLETFMSEKHTNDSMVIVHKFVENLVSATSRGAQNYPGRLMTLGLETAEVVSQCKDLIFAGTDSTGMNFATICRQLVLNPDKYALSLSIGHTLLTLNPGGKFSEQKSCPMQKLAHLGRGDKSFPILLVSSKKAFV